MDQELFEMDMERQYEDSSFELDNVNLDIQCICQQKNTDQQQFIFDQFQAEMQLVYYNPEFYSR